MGSHDANDRVPARYTAWRSRALSLQTCSSSSCDSSAEDLSNADASSAAALRFASLRDSAETKSRRKSSNSAYKGDASKSVDERERRACACQSTFRIAASKEVDTLKRAPCSSCATHPRTGVNTIRKKVAMRKTVAKHVRRRPPDMKGVAPSAPPRPTPTPLCHRPFAQASFATCQLGPQRRPACSALVSA